MHLETHKRQMRFAAPAPVCTYPTLLSTAEVPPSFPAPPKQSNTLSAKRESGSQGESVTKISWLERKDVEKATGSQ